MRTPSQTSCEPQPGDVTTDFTDFTDVLIRVIGAIRGHKSRRSVVGRRQKPVLNEAQMTYVVGRIEMKRLRRSTETDQYHLNSVRDCHRPNHTLPVTFEVSVPMV